MVVPAQPFDLITIGRTGVDPHARQPGMASDDVQTSGTFLGGSAANTAVAPRLTSSSTMPTRPEVESLLTAAASWTAPRAAP
ncbi:hypothetical protein DI272_07420 [Streptomyces sp. Act143]|nr:hypothetical protein DI272_07420 [Streptomyces sp. Act143]